MEIVQKLIALANKLDDDGLTRISLRIDDMAEGIVRRAQYVGSQGYWIRNERCYQNCYRQKRASSPYRPAQEVWFECQSEFQKQLNDGSKEWDKYAFQQNNGDLKFAKSITSAIADGIKFDDAVPYIIYAACKDHSDCLISASDTLLSIAEDLDPYDHDLAVEASGVSDLMLKEAAWGQQGQWGNDSNVGWGQRVKNLFNKNVFRNPLAKLDLSSLEQQLSQVDSLGRARAVDPKTNLYKHNPAYEQATQRLNALIAKNYTLIPAASPLKQSLDAISTAPAGQRLPAIQKALQNVRNEQAGVKVKQVETKPAPVETKPKPAPVEIKPKPAPVETKPKPVETKTKPTDAPESTPGFDRSNLTQDIQDHYNNNLDASTQSSVDEKIQAEYQGFIRQMEKLIKSSVPAPGPSAPGFTGGVPGGGWPEMGRWARNPDGSARRPHTV